MENKRRLLEVKKVSDMKDFIGVMNRQLSRIAYDLDNGDMSIRAYDREVDKWIALENEYELKFRVEDVK